MGLFKKVQDKYLTTYEGGMSVSPREVQKWQDAAMISGQSIRIPGGVRGRSTLAGVLAAGDREAQEFRKRISKQVQDGKLQLSPKEYKKLLEREARKQGLL